MPKGQTQVLRVQRIRSTSYYEAPHSTVHVFRPCESHTRRSGKANPFQHRFTDTLDDLLEPAYALAQEFQDLTPDSAIYGHPWEDKPIGPDHARQANKIALSRQPVLTTSWGHVCPKMAYQCSFRRATKRQYVQARATCTCGQGTHTSLPISAKPALGLAIAAGPVLKR